jgi:hypothetical protein
MASSGKEFNLDKSFDELPGFYRSLLPRIREKIAPAADARGLITQIEWNDSYAEISFVSKNGHSISPVRFTIPGPDNDEVERRKAAWSDADIYYLFAAKEDVGHNGHFTMSISHDDTVFFSSFGSIGEAIDAAIEDLRSMRLLETPGHPKCVDDIFAEVWVRIEEFADNASGGEIEVDVVTLEDGRLAYSLLDDDGNDVLMIMEPGPGREWICRINGDDVAQGDFDDIFAQHVTHESAPSRSSQRR